MSSSRSKSSDGRTDIAKSAATVGGLIGALGLGLPAAWIGYSTVAIPHRMPLPKAIDVEQRTFQSREAGRLSYYVDARGQGRPLVLLHSINAAGSSFEMKPLFERFQGQRPVYALDMPGFGFSERLDLPYTPELYAAALLEFLRREVPGESVDVVALSLSSEFAARAAVQAPGLFHSLTLISPSGFSGRERPERLDPGSASGAAVRRQRILSNPLWSQAIFDLLASRPSLRFFLRKSFEGPVDPELERYSYLTTHQPGARFAPIAFVSGRLFTPGAMEKLYAPLRVPALVLFDQDGYVTFGGLEEFVARHPGWRARRIAPTRGLPQFEQLEATARALEGFWSELKAPGERLRMDHEREETPGGRRSTLIATGPEGNPDPTRGAKRRG